MGRPKKAPDKVRMKAVQVRLTEDEFDQLSEIAKQHHRPVANLLYMLVSDMIANSRKEK